MYKEMWNEIYERLEEELGREPTDDEILDEMYEIAEAYV